MKTTILLTITILFSTQLSTNLIAQSYKQAKVKSLPSSKSKGNLIKSFNAPSKIGLIQVLSKDEQLKTLDHGPYKNVSVQTKQQSLLFPDGKSVDLDNNEIFIGATDNTLFTEKNDFEALTKKINFYSVQNNSVEKTRDISTSSEVTVSVLENGVLIISDEYEGYGTEATLYSPQGELILSYTPYEAGFKHAVFTSHNQFIYGCFESNDEDLLKVIKFNILNKQQEYEREINSDDFGLSLIAASNNSIVLYGFKRLIMLDKVGNVRWRKNNIVLPHFNLALSDDVLFLATQEDIFSMNVKDGSTNWKKRISDIYNTANQSQELSARPITFKILNDTKSLAIVIGMTKRGTLTPADIKYNAELVLLNHQGKLKEKINLEKELRLVDVIPTDTGFNLVDDHTIKAFENEQ